MSVKLLTEHDLEYLSLKEDCTDSKCHIVGNHMSRLKCFCFCFVALRPKSTAMVIAGR